MTKNFSLDTNVLLDDPTCISTLIDGDTNNIYLPIQVLFELDNLKRESRVSSIIKIAVKDIEKNLSKINIIGEENTEGEITDTQILRSVKNFAPSDIIFITNDKICSLLARNLGINTEPYLKSKPFQSESEVFTGFNESSTNKIINSFTWNEKNEPIFHGKDCDKVIGYTNKIWNIVPRTVHQNLAFELLLNNDIDVVSIQSTAGMGKTLISLAAAFHLTLQQNNYTKIYIIRPIIEIGNSLGYLPGEVSDKIRPYFYPIEQLIKQLNEKRKIPKIFNNPQQGDFSLDSRKIEFLPLNYVRGMNIDNAVVILDECQNMSRLDMRTILSRMGENVKCICTGDVKQIDNHYLNNDNNGLNWIVKSFKGQPNYAHIVLKGNKSRGPICDLVQKTGL